MGNIFLETTAFLLSVILCFYIPGRFLLSKLNLKLTGISDLFLSITAGFTSFTFLLYILSWMHLAWLSLVFCLGVAFVVIKKRLWVITVSKKELAPLVFIIICAVIFSLPMTLFGIHGNTIVYEFDDLWHLSLIQELKVNFPPGIPIFAGVQLTGYHFFSDFLQANISNLFFISPFNLHFYFFPVLTALLWGTGVYTLMITWTKKGQAGLWAVFLTMFGGSFAYILHFQGHPEVSLKEGLKMLQPATILYNPPVATSVVVLLFCLILLLQYLKTRQKRWLIPFIIAAGILPMFKVYAGIILYGGLVVLVLFEVIRKRFFLLQVCLATAVIAFLTFGVFLGNGGGFIWYPFWPIQGLLRDLKWYGYDEKMSTYTKQHVLRGLIETQLYGFVLFVFANVGTRLIGTAGLLFLKKKKPTVFALFIFVLLLISIVFPLFFIQTGKVFEIIQMTNYYLFFVSLFAAIGLTRLFELRYPFRKIGTVIGILLMVGLTLPSTIFSFDRVYAGVSQPSLLSDPYFASLFFLRNRGSYNDTLLILPRQNESNTLQDLVNWHYYSSAEIPALTNKRTYLAGVGIVYNGMNIETRLQNILMVRKFIQKPTIKGQQDTLKFLKKNTIHYIFSPYNAAALGKLKGVKQIYNDHYYIYEVTISS